MHCLIIFNSTPAHINSGQWPGKIFVFIICSNKRFWAHQNFEKAQLENAPTRGYGHVLICASTYFFQIS